MTNEIKTRRLIVTLPDCSGEEADLRAQDLEDSITGQPVGAMLPFSPNATVRHALGESLPPHTVVKVSPRENVYVDLGYTARAFTQSEARSLAGALLAAADQLAEGTPEHD